MATRTLLTPDERDSILERAADLHMSVYKAAKENMQHDAAMRAADQAVERWKLAEIKRVLSTPAAVQA